MRVLLLASAFILGNIQGQSIISPPADATQQLGESAIFHCEIEFGPLDAMTWEFNRNIIYSFLGGQEHYPKNRTDKYSVKTDSRSSVLKVNDLKYEDGGKFSCAAIISQGTATLIVLGDVSLILPSSHPVAGETALYKCEAHFGGPSEEEISQDHYPLLRMFFVDNKAEGTFKETRMTHLGYSYRLDKQYQVTTDAELHGKRLDCEVATTNPAMAVVSSNNVNVLYPVHNTSYSPHYEKYRIGENISCTADGNPMPSFEWDDLMKNGGRSENGNGAALYIVITLLLVFLLALGIAAYKFHARTCSYLHGKTNRHVHNEVASATQCKRNYDKHDPDEIKSLKAHEDNVTPYEKGQTSSKMTETHILPDIAPTRRSSSKLPLSPLVLSISGKNKRNKNENSTVTDDSSPSVLTKPKPPPSRLTATQKSETTITKASPSQRHFHPREPNSFGQTSVHKPTLERSSNPILPSQKLQASWSSSSTKNPKSLSLLHSPPQEHCSRRSNSSHKTPREIATRSSSQHHSHPWDDVSPGKIWTHRTEISQDDKIGSTSTKERSSKQYSHPQDDTSTKRNFSGKTKNTTATGSSSEQNSRQHDDTSPDTNMKNETESTPATGSSSEQKNSRQHDDTSPDTNMKNETESTPATGSSSEQNSRQHDDTSPDTNMKNETESTPATGSSSEQNSHQQDHASFAKLSAHQHLNQDDTSIDKPAMHITESYIGTVNSTEHHFDSQGHASPGINVKSSFQVEEIGPVDARPKQIMNTVKKFDETNDLESKETSPESDTHEKNHSTDIGNDFILKFDKIARHLRASTHYSELRQALKDDEEHDESKSRCLRALIFHSQYISNSEECFEWSQESINLVKLLLREGADPTWISAEDLQNLQKSERYTALDGFFSAAIVHILLFKTEMFNQIKELVTLFMSSASGYLEHCRGNALHAFVELDWKMLVKRPKYSAAEFFDQFKEIISKIKDHDSTVLDKADFFGRTPLHIFLQGVVLQEDLLKNISGIVQFLKSENNLNAMDNRGRGVLHYLIDDFPQHVKVTSQNGRKAICDVFLMVKTVTNIYFQDENKCTVLHILASRYNTEIARSFHEVFFELVKILSQDKMVVNVTDNQGQTVLHVMSEKFPKEVPEESSDDFLILMKHLISRSSKDIQEGLRQTFLQILAKNYTPNMPKYCQQLFLQITRFAGEMSYSIEHFGHQMTQASILCNDIP